jgi:hypothetical protein
MIRRLSKQDLDDCVKMVGIKPRTAGTVNLTKEKFIDSLSHYFDSSDNHVSLGYFKDTELICFICLGFFESKMRGKFWVISALYTKEFKPYFNFKDPDMGSLLKYSFEFAEQKGYYEFYYSIAERIMNAYERQWQRNSFMATGRYDRVILDRVPPNTVPNYELYWKLMGESIKPDCIIIKKRVLREEFRLADNSSRN